MFYWVKVLFSSKNLLENILLRIKLFLLSAFFIAYIISPKICHRFVGFLEEEAVITYTRCLEDLDAGRLPIWSKTPAPQIAKNYWKLKNDAMMKDVLLAVRADEATHRQYVNSFSCLRFVFDKFYILESIMNWLMLDLMHQILF